jgi:hypothetical protein
VIGRCLGDRTRSAHGRSPALAPTECVTCRPSSRSFWRKVRRVILSKRAAWGLLPARVLLDAPKGFHYSP